MKVHPFFKMFTALWAIASWSLAPVMVAFIHARDGLFLYETRPLIDIELGLLVLGLPFVTLAAWEWFKQEARP